MNEREELTTEIKAVVKRLRPYEVEALAAHLEQEGFRKTLDVSELERFRFDKAMFGGGNFFSDPQGPIVWFDDLRRLAAPKERWVAVTEPFEKHMRYNAWDGIIVRDCFFGYGPLTANQEKQDIKFNVECWRETGSEKPCRYPITHIQPIPSPPPTTPAQTAKEGI